MRKISIPMMILITAGIVSTEAIIATLSKTCSQLELLLDGVMGTMDGRD